MRIQAQHVKSGDRVRGLGLVVEFSEPETDHTTALEGHVSQRHEDGGQHFPVKVVLPNGHLVNVVRSDENFRADRVTLTEGVLAAFNTGAGVSFNDLVSRLTAVANLPRHREVAFEQVMAVANDLTGEESAEEIVERLDAINTEPIPFD